MMCFITQASPIVAKIQPTIFIPLCTVIPSKLFIVLYCLLRYVNNQKVIINAANSIGAQNHISLLRKMRLDGRLVQLCGKRCIITSSLTEKSLWSTSIREVISNLYNLTVIIHEMYENGISPEF